MADESETRVYWADKRRMNILATAIFLVTAGGFVLAATQILEAAWSAWWVVAGGLSLGFLVALASGTLMEYTLGKAYERIDLPLWEYAVVRFRFLFVLFVAPTAFALLASIIYFSLIPAVEDSSLLGWIVPRALAFLAIILFAGYVLPYLFRRAAGARETQSQRLRLIVSAVAEEMGMSVQGVYEAPLEGLRGANAAQVGFIRGRKSVFVLGQWEEHFTDAEIKAVLAHEFAHASRNHVGKLVALTALSRVGVPALVLLFTKVAIELFDTPQPPPTWAVVAISALAAAIVAGSHLLPRWVGRTFETEADAAGARIAGKAAMISALEKLAVINLIPRERHHLLSTHPSVQNRIQALRS